MPWSSRFEGLRQLGAQYWNPFLTVTAAVYGFAKIPPLIEVARGEEAATAAQSMPHLVAVVVVLVLLRFPRLAMSVTRVILPPARPPSDLPRLFRGPRPYAVDSPLPGRKSQVDECLQKALDGDFLIVEGESGTGKSSLLFSGVLPRLAQQFEVVTARVGEDPAGRLRLALVPLCGGTGRASGLEALAKAIDGVAAKPKLKPLLVYLDQLEELFFSTANPLREAFFATLCDAIVARKMRLIVSIRSDFIDLLLHLCRKVDPNQRALDVGRYFELKPLTPTQACQILEEILAPFQSQDVLLKEQVADFARALVAELLRPPRDGRLCAEDDKTVLPVELQIVGMMMEQLARNEYSVERFRRLGGKAGLLRAYLDDAKTYASRKAAIPPDQALVLLSEFVAPSFTRRSRTVAAVAEARRIGVPQVRAALDAFSEKYVLARVPSSQDTLPEAMTYELMHEHLARVLAEAPDPALRRAADVERRVRFWLDRAKVIDPFRTTETLNRRERVLSWFAQPIPVTEGLLLLAARVPESRGILVRNLRGFALRVLTVLLPIAVSWTAWSFTDDYQIRTILSHAPAEAIAHSPSPGSILYWISALAISGRRDDAIRVAHSVDLLPVRAIALASIARSLSDEGEDSQAEALGAEVVTIVQRVDDPPSRVLAGCLAAQFLGKSLPQTSRGCLNAATEGAAVSETLSNAGWFRDCIRSSRWNLVDGQLTDANRGPPGEDWHNAMFTRVRGYLEGLEAPAPIFKTSMLTAVARSWQELGDQDGAERCFLKAKDATNAVARTERDELLLQLIHSVQVTPSLARSTAQSISEPGLRAVALSYCARKSDDEAKEILGQAFEAAKSASDPTRTRGLEEVARAFTRLGLKSEAISVAEALPESTTRTSLLNVIAPTSTTRTVSELVRDACALPEAKRWEMLRVPIAMARSEGRREDARKLIDVLGEFTGKEDGYRIIETADLLTPAEVRAAMPILADFENAEPRFWRGRVDVAVALCRMGRSREGKQRFAALGRNARYLEPPPRDRPWPLSTLWPPSEDLSTLVHELLRGSAELAVDKESDCVSAASDATLEAAKCLTDTELRSRVGRDVSIDLSKIGFLRAARHAADTSIIPADRLIGYAGILLEQASRGKPATKPDGK